MKNTRLSVAYQISQETALCWSPVAALRSTIHNGNFSNMIEAGNDLSKVREGWDD